jgi:hypothetical protein
MPKTLKADARVQAQARISVTMLLKFLMLRGKVSFRDLAKKLNDHGFEENERNLRNKISKGEMQASLFLICLKLLGGKELSIQNLPLPEIDSEGPVEILPEG